MILGGCFFLAPPMKVFRDQMDHYYVGKTLSEYRRVYVSAEIQDIQEVRPGVSEYFIEQGKGVYRPGTECRIVLVVENATDKIIAWRYNGNPNNCRIAS